MLDSTRQFIQAMDAKNIKHSDIEVTDSGMEKVTVIYTGGLFQGGQRGQPPLPLCQVRAGHQ